MTLFAGAARRGFEDQVLRHIKRCFPVEAERSGEPRLRQLIQYGIRRASDYGITTARGICQYIDVMVVFGRDFDRDAALGWASGILTGRHLRTSAARLERLYEVAELQDTTIRNGHVAL